MLEDLNSAGESDVAPTQQDVNDLLADQKPAPKSPRSKGSKGPEAKKRQRPAKQRNKNKSQQTKSQQPAIVKQFAACGRCSFFWAGYRLIDRNFDEAQTTPVDGWLTLVWNYSVRDLIYKSFGSRIDLDFYHYESCCSACQRPFVFQGQNGEEQPACLRIRL